MPESIVGIDPTTLSAGTPQPGMSFMTGQMPNAWIYSGAASSWSTGTSSPDWLLGGIGNVTPQQGGAAAWPLPESTPSGSPSPDLDQGMPMISETYKPNGS
jgi:hypothetical protein